MKLLKSAWTLLKGVKDVLVLILMLIFFGTLYALLSSGPNPSGGKDGALLISLDGPIVEQASPVDPRELLMGQSPTGGQYKLADVVQAIRAAAEDDNIKTVVLDLDSFPGAGQTSLEDVGAALDKVRAAKKPVLVFATGYDDASYLLASHASEIWLDPMGAAWFPGPGGSRLYYKGLIDRLGVNVHVYRVGKFKSFVEPYIRADQSPEAKAANEALVSVIWSNWQANVAKARPKAKLGDYIGNPAGAVAEAGGSLSNAALKAGVVDRLGDRIAFSKRVAEIAGDDNLDPARPFRFSTLDDYVAAHPASKQGDAIGIVQVAGQIVDGEAPAGTAGGKSIADLITKAVASERFKALVVRVDSPGGSALASEQIRLALAEAKTKGMPVVTSMGAVAASGGYWVAMAGDKVFAEPSTITGSIGVFGIVPTFETTLAKYGVTSDGVKTTPLSGQPDLYGGTTPQTDALIQAGVDDIYARFLDLVSKSRKLAPEKVAEIAQGRVWDGGSARQLGLIDAFGGLDDAVAEAGRLAKLDPDEVHGVVIEEPQGWLSSIFGTVITSDAPRTDIFTRLARKQQALVIQGFADAEALLSGPAVQVRCLECETGPRQTKTRVSLWKLIENRIFS